MKIKSTQLTAHLKRHGISSLYLLTGDEPLQMMECADTLREFARKQGFTDRVVLSAEAGFDWDTLEMYTNNFSLFASKRFLEIRLGKKTPGNDGTKALIAHFDNLSASSVLLITADKLDASKQKAKWFKALDEKGVVIPVWSLNLADFPKWIEQRMSQHGLQASAEAINIIAERSEGHLLACAQEIEKLRLLHGKGRIETVQVLEAVANSARFELFNWVDTVLAGDVQRCVRQLESLRAEGVEPVLVLWALNREIRTFCHMTYALQRRQRLEQVLKTFRVWSTRKNAITSAIKRHPQPGIWRQFLQETVQIDRIVKGVGSGNAWDELQRLSLRVAGVKLFDYDDAQYSF